MILASFILFILYFFLFLEYETKLMWRNKDISVWFIVISLLLLFLFQIQAQPKFNDYLNYTSFYQKVEAIDQVFNGNNSNFKYPDIAFEIGYKYLNSIFKYFTSNELIFLYAINIFSILIVCRFIKKYSYSFFLVFGAYYALIYPSFQLGILRQAIANVFFLYAVDCLVNRKYLYYFVIILIALLFHATAIILLLLPFFANRTLNVKLVIGIFVIGNLLYFFHIDVVIIILKGILLFSDLSISNSIIYYLDDGINNNFLGIGFWDRTLQFICLYFIYKSLSKKQALDVTTNLFFNIALFALLLQLYSFNYPVFTNRLRFYFYLFLFLLIDKYLVVTRSNSNKFIMLFYSVIYCSLMFMISTAYLQSDLN